ncbi:MULTISPECIES: TIGR03620 family F420-dependent LLM class oxidoreductase [unclassified Frankia]|uniref:TIGR03620 family F420-dependent LLM class oxidoreductase n=1 Tax=unclassified Frankia TaxID=2632575 RepID=UPI002AD1E83A|nr:MULTISPECIES: TIGR03620 family F420-dependent LLM class oxidoreductase [unclassified Frankia]
MSKIELGPVGAVLSPAADGLLDAAVELEDLGYSTIWLTGGPLGGLGQIADLVRATRTVRVASGIISVDRFEPEAVAALYTDLEATHPGRFVVGLGGAHGAKPVQTLTAYLDALGAVPATARVLAALGPRMLELARRCAAGALPVLVTPDYTVRARSLLGEDTTLAIEQLVVLDTDPGRARGIARGPLGFLSTVPAYPANFRRMGFTEDEITHLDDRLVDALVAWGDVHAVAARVSEHVRAGADHVAVSVTTGSPETIPIDQWRALAKTLIP